MGAPVVKTIDDCVDPERAYELLPGKTRSSTLKRYVTMYNTWRLWLQEAKRVDPPGRPADLVDYLLVLRDEPCVRTVPDSLLKAVSWIEKVAEFKFEVLYEGAPLIKRAPRYPVIVLVAIERVVLDDSEPTGLRVYAWAKVKVWASLRWSDLQAIRPGELKLVEGRLVTTLRRTKTSGPNRRIKEMPLCVSEAAFFENPAWLKGWLRAATVVGDLWPGPLATQAEAELRGLREEDGRVCGCGCSLGRYPAESGHPRYSPRLLDRALREISATHWAQC